MHYVITIFITNFPNTSVRQTFIIILYYILIWTKYFGENVSYTNKVCCLINVFDLFVIISKFAVF